MPKLRPLSRKEFIKKLKNVGLEGPFQGGDHQFMSNENLKIKIPQSS
jgi:predicted RNA binding protein YcfA (HicA-like mRNA interferase family)